MRALILFLLAVSVVSVAGNDEPVNEGRGTLNKYLQEERRKQFGGRHAWAPAEINNIGKPVEFKLGMERVIDKNIVGARLILGEIHDFFARCGSSYSHEWCESVVHWIKNSVAFRELDLAVSAAHAQYQSPVDARHIRVTKDAIPGAESYDGTRESYDRLVRQRIERVKKERAEV